MIMEGNSVPEPSAGICQRLFMLVIGSLRRASAPPTRAINVEGSEIVVEFRHATNSDKGKKSSVSFKKEAARDDQDETAKTRRHWPLLGVASNINEKSEAFIESKKKAMGRNYSLDH